MSDALFEKGQGFLQDGVLDAERSFEVSRLLAYANMAQSMAHDCAVALRVLQAVVDYEGGDGERLLSDYGHGALKRLIGNSMSLIAAEGERVLDSVCAPAPDALVK